MDVSSKGLLKFEPKELDEILNKYNVNKRKILKTTLKYVYKLKDSEDFNNIVSINSNTVNINFRKLLSNPIFYI